MASTDRNDAQPTRSPVEVKNYSFGEEVAHATTHGVGIVAAIAGLTALVARAALHGDAWHITASAVFGATLILMYTASTLYHSIPLPDSKRILRVIDHASIYLLIAGTYTPFTLITLRGPWGWTLFGIVWSMALLGVVFKLFHTGRFKWLSLSLYIAMGWCVVVAIQPLVAALPTGGLVLLGLGGLCYTGGVVFYIKKTMRWHHAIWHGFVVAGSVLHYLAVYFYVIPGA